MNRFFLLLLVTFILQVIGQVDKDARRKHIASRDKRQIRLENILEHQRKQLTDHYSGIDTLTANQIEHLEHKIRAYEHQLEELSRELDEQEIQDTIENYEKLKASRRTHDEL